MTTLRGAETASPVRDWIGVGFDKVDGSKFPSVDGRAGDMLLMSQSFDDFKASKNFGAPKGTSLLGYVGKVDETGFLFGKLLTQDGPTGTQLTIGAGGNGAKDALVSPTTYKVSHLRPSLT